MAIKYTGNDQQKSQNGIFEIHGTASYDAVPWIVDAVPPDAVSWFLRFDCWSTGVWPCTLNSYYLLTEIICT
jgi:hypothetical protein